MRIFQSRLIILLLSYMGGGFNISNAYPPPPEYK